MILQKMHLPLLLTLLLISFASLSSQQQGANSTADAAGSAADVEAQFTQLFSSVDKDGDGKISLGEALEFWQEKSKTMDPEELKKKMEKFRAKSLKEAVERGFKKVDKDSDGSVSPDELKAYLQS